jgi:3-oxoacyl-[acyl-carrier-protein] synthase-1
MRAVWSIADSIISPLGYTSDENYMRLRSGISGVTQITHTLFHNEPFYAAAVAGLSLGSGQSRLEQMSLRALRDVLRSVSLPPERTLFILSTTKGNIDLLDQAEPQRLALHETATYLARESGFMHSLVISNACISGVLALIVAKRYIEAGQYDHAVVLGADVLSPFVVSGFKSLNALSAEPCRPFDAQRAGINLGEAAAVIILSSAPDDVMKKPAPRVRLLGAGVSNDANHISGPSRTGQELAHAIRQALLTSGLQPQHLDAVSAHGTATVYNDEMEAKAFDLAGLADVPVNSLKGYYGHTLGAAGIVETIISAHSLHRNELLPTYGFTSLGVSRPIHICDSLRAMPLRRILKTASGFGGCNAALVIEKENPAS